MIEFLGATCLPMILVIAFLELAMCGFMVFRYVKTKSLITLVIACLTFGLFYDALVIGLGGFVNPEGAPFFSRMRFILHGILIPLLFVIIALGLDFKKPWNLVLFILTGVLMVAGIAEALATDLIVKTVGGVSRFADSGNTPGWATAISNVLSFGTVIPLMVAGVYYWVKNKNPFLFLSGFFMFAFSAAGAAALDFMFYISMYGELLMVIFLILFVVKKEKKLI